MNKYPSHDIVDAGIDKAIEIYPAEKTTFEEIRVRIKQMKCSYSTINCVDLLFESLLGVLCYSDLMIVEKEWAKVYDRIEFGK